MPTNVAEVRLGDLFVREGLIDAGQLQEALKDAKESGTRVGFSLVKLGFVAENELTRTPRASARPSSTPCGRTPTPSSSARCVIWRPSARR